MWENSLFDLGEEPPDEEVAQDRDGEDELASADERETEECRAANELRVVEVATTCLSPCCIQHIGSHTPVDPRVFEIRREVFNKEVSKEPTYELCL